MTIRTQILTFTAAAALATAGVCYSAQQDNRAAASRAGLASASSQGSGARIAVTVPSGTPIQVRLNHSLSTDRNRPGDRFEGVLQSPLAVDGRVLAGKGSVVRGFVRDASPSGRLKGRAVLTLALDSIDVHGRTFAIRTGVNTRVSAAHKKRNLKWIGGGSGTGALIGAVAGGGVGAAIGAGAGAAAGLTGAVVTGRRQVRVPAESLMTFRLQQPLTIGG